MTIQFWIWSPRNTGKTPIYPAHFLQSLHSVVSVQNIPHLSHLSSTCSCASTSCRSSSHCVSWLSESLNFGVERKRASSEHSLSPRFCNGLHVIKTSRSAFGCCWIGARDELLPFRLRSSPKPHCPVSPGPQETAQTTRLILTSSILRGDCPRSVVHRLHSSTSRSARPSTLHHSSRTQATSPVQLVSDNLRAKSFNSDGQLLTSNHPRQKPEAACNSHSATAAKS